MVEFDDFLNSTFGRLSPTPKKEIDVLVASVLKTYRNYFAGDFGTISQELDLKGGGLGKIGNITLKLENIDNIIKSIRPQELINTTVSIYVLLQISTDVPNREYAELRYKGVIQDINWDSNFVIIKLISNLYNNDYDMLKTQILEKDYPNADEKVIGQWVHLIGGKGLDSLELYNLSRHLKPTCTTPALCVDTTTNKYLIADNIIKDFRIPSDTQIRDSSVLKMEQDNGGFWQLQNVEITAGDLALPYFNLPVPDTQEFIHIKPKYVSTGTSVRPQIHPEYAIDDNNYCLTGYDCKTSSGLVGRPEQILFKFKNISDQLQKGVKTTVRAGTDIAKMHLFVKIRNINEQGKLCFIIKSNGKSYYRLTSWDEWQLENDTQHIYRILPENNLTNPDVDESFCVTQDDDISEIIYSCNIFAGLNDFIGAGADRHCQMLLGGVWNTCTFPPTNIGNLDVDQRNDFNGPQWDRENILATELEKVELGVMAIEGVVEVESFGLHINGVYYEGGYNPPTPNEPVKYIPLYIRNFYGAFHSKNLVSDEWKNWEEEYEKWWERKQEIDGRSNVGPIDVITDGYPIDNTVNTAVAQKPVDHMKHLMKYRTGDSTGVAPGVSWDATSFDFVDGKRSNDVGSAFTARWQFHYDQGDQIKLSLILKEMAYQCNCFVWFDISENKYFIKTLDWLFDVDQYVTDYGVVAQFDQSDMLSYKLAWDKEVFDSFIINYAWSSITKKFMGQLVINPTEVKTNYYDEGDDIFAHIDPEPSNYDIDDFDKETLVNLCKDIHNNYFKESNDEENLHTLVKNADKIRNVNTLRRFAAGLVKKHTKLRPILSLETTPKSMLLKEGDVIYIGRSDWSSVDRTYYQVKKIVEGVHKLPYEITCLQIGHG